MESVNCPTCQSHHFDHYRCKGCGQDHGYTWPHASGIDGRLARYCGLCGHKFEDIPEAVQTRMNNEEEDIRLRREQALKIAEDFDKKLQLIRETKEIKE